MAKIYSPPKEVPIPDLNFETWREDEIKFTEALRAYCQKHGKGTERGEVVRFPVADGHAQYMVLNLRPLTLIHMPLGDAWHFQYVNRLTANDIKEQIRREKAFAAIFEKAGK